MSEQPMQQETKEERYVREAAEAALQIQEGVAKLVKQFWAAEPNSDERESLYNQIRSLQATVEGIDSLRKQ